MSCLVNKESWQFKRGASFDLTLRVPSEFADGHFAGWALESKVRTPSGGLIAALTAEWVARALADALGVTLGQLRAMAEGGKLSSEVVISALKSQAKVLKEEFATLPATIERSVQNLSTAWSLFVDETDRANNVSGRIAGTIDLLAANLGTLMSATTFCRVAPRCAPSCR